METSKSPAKGPMQKTGKYLLRILGTILLTVFMLLLFAYFAMFIICKGPSPTARNLFVLSVRETSAIGFLADIFLSDEEIAAIEARPAEDIQGTDTSLIEFAQLSDDSDGPVADKWGYIDDDGDGIIIVPVAGESYVGKMMIVLDPSRVKLGCVPEHIGYCGHTVEEFALMNDAVAAINGGGFVDINGQGDGSTPDTLVVVDGQICCGGSGIGYGFVGLDSSNILHVGFTSSNQIQEWDIQQGTSFGPVLVSNGEIPDESSLVSGLNPRTAIGQRSDGAILMLVIEGRQPNSLGATFMDEAELMLDFGAVNACNLDGGSSSLMWFNGEYINNCASVIGIRDIPTSFVVLKEGASRND